MTVNGKTFSITKCINDGVNGIREFPVPAIGGFSIIFFISFIIGFIPFINFIYSIFFNAAFMGGLSILMLNIKDKNNPLLENILEGFAKFTKFLGIFWIMMLIFLIICVPGIILLRIAAANKGTFLYTIINLLILVILIPTYIRLSLSFFVGADTDLGAVDCINRSIALTRGNSWQIFLYYLVCLVIISLGLLCLLIGVFVAGPITMIGAASIYRQLAGKNIEAPPESK